MALAGEVQAGAAAVLVLLSLTGLVLALAPPRPALARSVSGGRADREAQSARQTVTSRPEGRRAGRPLASALEAGGLLRGAAPDLVLLERPASDHALAKVLGGLVGAAAAPLAAAVLGLDQPSWAMSAAAAGAVTGFLSPDRRLRREANRRRRSFVNAQACAMELVAGVLEAGENLNGAMDIVLNASDNWAFVRLRRCVTAARVEHVSAWVALRRLGDEAGIPELEVFANTIEAALRSGAPAREALEAAAESMRSEQLRSARERAVNRNEARAPAVVLLALAPLTFVGFCALNASFTYLPK